VPQQTVPTLPPPRTDVLNYTKTVDVHDAQHQLAELIAQVAAGIEIILTDGHQPRARLVPIVTPTTRRVPGLHA